MARYGIIIAAMLTLVGDNGGGDQVAAPPQPPSRPAQVSMKAADWTLKHSPRDFTDAPNAKQENEACAPPLSFSR